MKTLRSEYIHSGDKIQGVSLLNQVEITLHVVLQSVNQPSKKIEERWLGRPQSPEHLTIKRTDNVMYPLSEGQDCGKAGSEREDNNTVVSST